MQYTYLEVAGRYGLSTPQQIKDRIMWNSLKAIICHLYDDDESKKLVERYEADFRTCEKEQLNKGT